MVIYAVRRLVSILMHHGLLLEVAEIESTTFRRKVYGKTYIVRNYGFGEATSEQALRKKKAPVLFFAPGRK